MSIYMKIDGINGNVTAKGYEKWIELKSLDFGVTRNINTQPGKVADRESTKPSISEVVVTKLMDQTSPLLFSEACVGKTKSVEIHMVQTGDNVSPYAEYKIDNAMISSYKVGHDMGQDGGNGYPSEQVSINFDKIEYKYIPYDESHKAQSPIPAGYDLKTAQKI